MMLAIAARPDFREQNAEVSLSSRSSNGGLPGLSRPRCVTSMDIEQSGPRPIVRVLTSLEQSVVALAAVDAPKSIRKPGMLARVASRIFGGRPANQLADPRLETLRRFAIIIRTNSGPEDPGESEVLARAGFTKEAEAEIRGLLRSLDQGRLPQVFAA